MQMLFASDVAIAAAIRNNTLRIHRGINRFGDEYFAIEDDHGVITIALSAEEADDIVSSVKTRIAA